MLASSSLLRFTTTIRRFAPPISSSHLHFFSNNTPKSKLSLSYFILYSFTSRTDHTMASQSNPNSVHDFTVKDVKGNEINLGDFKGKVLLIVNVASQCGLTDSNYTELNQLYDKYKQKGLEILAFPCNQFAGQEPGSNEQIQEIVCTRFKAEFPVFDKIEVNGDNSAPLYKFLKSAKYGILGDNIQWNFSKFLVDKDGQVADRYYPTTSPLSLERDISKLLGIE